MGWFETLPEALQEAMVEMARQLRQNARVWERSDRKEQCDYKEMKREQALQLQVEALAERGAIIVERFDARERAVTSWKQVETELRSISHDQSGKKDTDAVGPQISYLRFQIELRVLGMGWSDLAVPWKQADESTKDQLVRLRGHLREVLNEAKNSEVPTEAPLPDFKAKSLKQLGTPSADSTELRGLALCSPAQLAAAIERERQRRITAGFADGDAVQAAQPATAPATDEHLAGAQLEICWTYTSTVDNKTKVRGSHSNRRHPRSMGRHTCTMRLPWAHVTPHDSTAVLE